MKIEIAYEVSDEVFDRVKQRVKAAMMRDSSYNGARITFSRGDYTHVKSVGGLDEVRAIRALNLVNEVIEAGEDDTLTVAGKALFGERWQSELARAIGVSDRSVRGWVAGEREPPEGIWPEIADLLKERRKQIDAILSELS